MQHKKNKEFKQKSEYQKKLSEFNAAVINQSERFQRADDIQINKGAPRPTTPSDTPKKTPKQSIYAI